MTEWTPAALGEALAAHEHGDFAGSARLAGDILDQEEAARARRDEAFAIMPKVGHIERHCETVLRNDDCPYIRFGCYGCSRPGPRTEESRERARAENKALGLPDTADGIDRMAAASGRTRDEQIALLDPVARAVARLVAVGLDKDAAESAALKIVEVAGAGYLGRLVDSICRTIGQPAPPMLGPGIPGCSGDEYAPYSYVSPCHSMVEFNEAEIRRATNKHEPGRRDGKRAQRNMLKPWAKRGARR